MISRIVIFLWFMTIFVTGGIQLPPTKTEDLQSLVESIKKDVDWHLQNWADKSRLTNSGLTSDETIFPSKSSTKNYTVLNDETPINDNSQETAEYSSDGSEAYYGSVKGRPDIDFPAYTDIPRTSFTCSDKTKFPRFYADLDTGCQVFHVCWPDRRESFLCPMGTIFNQAISACDYWHNTNCSMTLFYYKMNSELEVDSAESENIPVINTPVQKTDSLTGRDPATSVMFFVSEFMPIKARIVVYPKTKKQRQKIASVSTGKTESTVNPGKRARVSKHSHMPLSLEYTSSSTDSLEKLQSKIAIYHVWEALNNAVIEVQKDKSTARLSQYAENILKFIKYWFMKNESPSIVKVKPGTKLYEYNIRAQKTAKSVQFLFQKSMELVADFLNELNVKDSKEFNHDVLKDELLASKDAPLTNLNPRFIVKPADTKVQFEEINDSSNLGKAKVKPFAASFNPIKLSPEDPVGIYQKTKEALLKSYVKLFKAKKA